MAESTSTASGSVGQSAFSEMTLGVAMVAILGVMILPMPAFLLDLLLSLSVSLSLVILLFSLHIERPLEFSAFPSLLLLTTLMRLALNVASTRLILLHGNEGVEAAGHVIATFGQFVVGGNLVVGIIIFSILVVINFVVITKGSGRIGEVAARFTLDSMPGKQMAIDADLAAGLCTEAQAKIRRQAVEQEADFFGAMDGAGKFVRGDAVAGLLVVAVNIIGGLIIGVVQQHMPVGRAMTTYTSLTVGDGLLSQIPSLLTSIAAGLVTTRAATGGSLSQKLSTQLFGTRRILMLAAGVLALMAVVPGMPHVAFFALATLFGGIGFSLGDGPKPLPDAAPLARGPEVERLELEGSLPLDLLEVEVGYELVPLVDTERDGSLMHRVAGLRKQLAQDLGILIPPIHMRDNLNLEGSEYRILLSGNQLAQGHLKMNRLMAIGDEKVTEGFAGDAAKEPAFGLPAKWIVAQDRQRAEMSGLTVVDPATVIATHLSELLAAHAHDLLGRRELQELLDLHGRSHSRVIEELLPGLLNHAQMIRVLRNLLRERVSIRDFRSICEALADNAHDVKDPDALTEAVRQRLHQQLTERSLASDGQVHALVLSPAVETSFRRMISQGALDPPEMQRLAKAFEMAQAKSVGAAHAPVLLTSAEVRRSVSSFAARYMPSVQVLSFRELNATARVNTVGIVTPPQEDSTVPSRAPSSQSGALAHAI